MKLAGAYIAEDKHAALKELARRNHRTLADQLRCLFDRALAGDLLPAAPRAIIVNEAASATLTATGEAAANAAMGREPAMKEIVSLAASHLIVYAEDRPVALTEVVLVTAEPEYVFDAGGELARRRALFQTRFAATTAELRELAATFTLWANERDRTAAPA